MKIMAPASHLMTGDLSSAAFIRDLMAHFRETDPTQIIRLLSLLYHEPVETLVESFSQEDGFQAFQMISYGFAMNAIADLVAASKFLGFIKPNKIVADPAKEENDG